MSASQGYRNTLAILGKKHNEMLTIASFKKNLQPNFLCFSSRLIWSTLILLEMSFRVRTLSSFGFFSITHLF